MGARKLKLELFMHVPKGEIRVKWGGAFQDGEVI